KQVATDGRILAHVFAKPQPSQLRRRVRKVDRTRNVQNHVHVPGRPGARYGRVRNQKATHHAADEDDSLAQPTQLPCYSDDLPRYLHQESLFVSSLPAIWRSRARPARTASTSASHSWSCGFFR